MPARDLKLARECGRALPRNHPLYRRKLELSAKHTALAFGHRSLLENCPLFLCLILGVHSMLSPRREGVSPHPGCCLQMQNARAVDRRAQFRLWIFSYTM